MGDQRARVRRLRAAQHQPTREAEVASWPDTVRPAVGAGAQEAQVGLGAAYGSNWVGPFSRDDRMALRAAQVEAWEAAGIVPTRVSLADTMAWNTPSEVSGDLEEIRRRWPAITRFHLHLHLHNTRGCAQVSLYEALRLLGPECVVEADCSIGGMAGCPYCGNGRAATLTPTEDLVHLLESLGYYTGVDLDALVDAVVLAEEIAGPRRSSAAARRTTQSQALSPQAPTRPWNPTRPWSLTPDFRR